jgi:hypothetical protein
MAMATVFTNGRASARLRGSPAGITIAPAPHGTVIEVLSDPEMAEGKLWRKIRLPSGLEGWLDTDFIKLAGR